MIIFHNRDIKKYISPVIAGITIFSLSSCSVSAPDRVKSSPTNQPTANSPTATNTTEPNQINPNITPGQIENKPSIPNQKNQAVGQNNSLPANSKNTVTVTFYKADSQCEKLIPEKVNVAADKVIENVVGEVIKQQTTADFNLEGYRVNVDRDTGVATIDFRLAPNSKRKFTSLSSCEQMALFGSLTKSLTSNSDWQIKEVRFTDRGKEIIL